VNLEHLSDHLFQFENLGGYPKSTCPAFNLICLLSVWVIWSEINARVCNQKEVSLSQLLDIIKSQSYWRLKANHPNFAFTYQLWCLNPLSCLRIFL